MLPFESYLVDPVHGEQHETGLVEAKCNQYGKKKWEQLLFSNKVVCNRTNGNSNGLPQPREHHNKGGEIYENNDFQETKVAILAIKQRNWKNANRCDKS